MHGTNSPPPRPSKSFSSPPLPMHVSQPDISLSLTHHTVIEIDTVITATNTVHNGAHVKLSHLTMPINLNHLRRLHRSMNLTQSDHLSYRVIYHHLLISARSLLIPRTMNNIIHTLTPTYPNVQLTPQHNLYLFLNPYKGTLSLTHL